MDKAFLLPNKNNLLLNIDKIHTTELRISRIAKNVGKWTMILSLIVYTIAVLAWIFKI